MDIGRAIPSDFADIAALDRVAWRTSHHGTYIPDGEHAWRIWCEHALTYVARDGGRVVGAILAFPCLDGRFCLHKVMVARDRRGRGIGSDLFRALLAELDGREAATFLTVSPANAAALALYEKWGFTGRKLVHGYYRPQEDRYVMTRPPQPPTDASQEPPHAD
jgi:ribosomal protein S18 acetylase RimI-like enzyme